MHSSFIQIFSLTLPVLIPGLFLVLVLKLKLFEYLDKPIDLSIEFRGRRLFGKNKTLRGLMCMTTAIPISVEISQLYSTGYANLIHPVFRNDPVLLGFIFAASYVTGELTNSFFKRQMGIPPGELSTNSTVIQRIVDLSDGIVMVVLSLIIFFQVPALDAAVAGFFGILLHSLIEILMQFIGLKKSFKN